MGKRRHKDPAAGVKRQGGATPGGAGGEGEGGASTNRHHHPTNGIELGASVLDTHRRLIAVDATGARVAVAAGPSVRAVDLCTGAALIDEGASDKAHGGAHVTALAWWEPTGASNAGAPVPPPPRLLTGGLDKRVRLWGSSGSGLAPLGPGGASWQAPKKITAVSPVSVAGGEPHVFYADRYGDVLCAPLLAGVVAPAAAAAEAEAEAADAGGDGNNPPKITADDRPGAFAIGHLSSTVSRVLAVPASAAGAGGHPALVATADADGKVRLSRLPPPSAASASAFLARHGCPEVQAYAMGHQSAVVDLALLMLPVGWVRGAGGGGKEGGSGGDAAAAASDAAAATAATATTTTPVVVSGGADGTVRLWCPSTGAELCRAVVGEEGGQEEEEGGQDGNSSGGDDDDDDDNDGGGGEGQEQKEEEDDDDDKDEEAAAARQAMERMQRLEAALAPGEGDYLRDARCPSVAAVAAAGAAAAAAPADGDGANAPAPATTARPPLVAVAVEGQHPVAVFAVEQGSPPPTTTTTPLRLRLLRRSPVPGVRFPTSLQFAPAPAPLAQNRQLLLWAAGGWPSAALISGAPAAAVAVAADADASADVGAADALTGEEAGVGVASPASAAAADYAPSPLAALRRQSARDGGGQRQAESYPVPLLWRRREAERWRQGRAHGPRLKRGRTDFAETARLARLHGGGEKGQGKGNEQGDSAV